MAEAAKQRAAAHQQHREQQQRVYQYLRLRRALYIRELEEEEEEEVSMGPLTSCHCRVVRSLGGWSGGLRKPQSSILEAYEQVISTAEHFLYFENPSFISGLRGDTDVTNRLAEALLNRIVQAHDRHEAFRVMVLLPLLPVYDGSLHGATSTMLTSALYYQLTSVKALWTRLAQMVPCPEDYLQFFGLRTFSRLNGDASKQQLPLLMTEQIFVNSRLLVSDDRYAILGSAALNERSMLGSRDSEVAVVLEDTMCEPGLMNNCGYQAGTFARSLRLRLWGEHVGLLDEYVQHRAVEAALVADQAEELLEDAPAPEDVYAPLLDPTSQPTWDYLRDVARKNTAILAHVFPQALPANTIRSLGALKQVTVDGVTLQATREFVESVLGDERAAEEEEALMEALLDEQEEASQEGGLEDGERSTGSQARRDVEKEKLKWLGRLRGHLVQYPMDFLADDLKSLRPINGLQGWTM
jgi:phosphatidylserine/phosphatidylglycerophosphate/cardiolipin synthase-like enzyme